VHKRCTVRDESRSYFCCSSSFGRASGHVAREARDKSTVIARQRNRGRGGKGSEENFSEKFETERSGDTKGIRVSTDTLLHVGSRRPKRRRSAISFPQSEDADSAGDSVCWFARRMEDIQRTMKRPWRASKRGRERVRFVRRGL
jgi:hypothetical protein